MSADLLEGLRRALPFLPLLALLGLLFMAHFDCEDEP